MTLAMPWCAAANLLYMGDFKTRLQLLNMPGCTCVCKLPPLPRRTGLCSLLC